MAAFEDRLAKVTGLVWFASPIPPSQPPQARPPVWGGIPAPSSRNSFLFGDGESFGSGTANNGYPSPPANVPPGGSGPADWHDLAHRGPTIILAEMLAKMAKNGASSQEAS